MINVNLVGRSVSRILCHNGIYAGRNINSRVSKCFLSTEDEDFAKSQGEKAQMTITPIGIFCIMRDGSEKLVPWANLYEADLFPEVKAKAAK